MQKILLVINSEKPDLSSIEFACQFAALAGTKITGLFVENQYFDYLPIGDMSGGAYVKIGRENNRLTAETAQAIKIFKEQCERKGIDTEIYMDKGEPVREVVYESRFADLLLINPSLDFYDNEEKSPSHFIREILAKAECPVLLTSEDSKKFDEVVFCYDGSASSVYAIKQFTYLFSKFANKKATLLEVRKSGGEEFDEAHKKVMEWLRAHYHSVYYRLLQGEAEEELFTYFFMKENMLIVMGAYGRPILSRIFSKSKADTLLRTINLPVFITHY